MPVLTLTLYLFPAFILFESISASTPIEWWTQYGALGAFTAFLLWMFRADRKEYTLRLEGVIKDYNEERLILLETLKEHSAAVARHSDMVETLMKRASCPYQNTPVQQPHARR